MFRKIQNLLKNSEIFNIFPHGIFNINFSDNDFIRAGLGGMGYSRRLYKKTIPNYKFSKGLFQTRIKKKKNILQVVMFQNVLMDPKISKEKQISLFFSMFFGFFMSFQKKLNFCVPIIFECKYVLFHLNMLILFKRLTCF